MFLDKRGRGGEVVMFVDGDKVTFLCGFFLEGLVVGGVVQLVVELHGLIAFGERIALT